MTGFLFYQNFIHNVIVSHKHFYIDHINSHAVQPVTHWADQ